LKLKIAILSFIVISLLSTGCFGNNTGEANKLINKANLASKHYVAIENNEIAPLALKIQKTEGTKSGAKISLGYVKKILEKNNDQFELLSEAKSEIARISGFRVSEELKKYAQYTLDALDADIETLRISRNLYLELQNLYGLIAKNTLEQKKFEKISQNVENLSRQAEVADKKQKKLDAKKDAYYKKALAQD